MLDAIRQTAAVLSVRSTVPPSSNVRREPVPRNHVPPRCGSLGVEPDEASLFQHSVRSGVRQSEKENAQNLDGG